MTKNIIFAILISFFASSLVNARPHQGYVPDEYQARTTVYTFTCTIPPYIECVKIKGNGDIWALYKGLLEVKSTVIETKFIPEALPAQAEAYNYYDYNNKIGTNNCLLRYFPNNLAAPITVYEDHTTIKESNFEIWQNNCEKYNK